MISRHSKRDIRLPARYHNSNIMIGNEWVTASVDPVSEKKGRKRLVEEQKRLLKMMEQVQCSPKKKKSCDAPSARMIKELHTKVKLDRELQKPKREKEPLQKVEACISTSTAKSSALPPDPVISSPGKSVMGSQIKVINQELKELYRNLYFENVPERRIHFQMKGIKPRVNKHQAVEEAIEVLEKLKKRESQLAYIHKLMSIWNKKLELCRKVMMKEVEPEPTPDGKNYVNVVANVLKAYQSSICYKVQEALTKNECQEDSNQQKLTTKTMDHLSSPRIIATTASKKDVMQSDDSSKALISPNESQPRIIGYRPLKKNGLITETSMGKSAPGKKGLITETSMGKSSAHDEEERSIRIWEFNWEIRIWEFNWEIRIASSSSSGSRKRDPHNSRIIHFTSSEDDSTGWSSRVEPYFKEGFHFCHTCILQINLKRTNRTTGSQGMFTECICHQAEWTTSRLHQVRIPCPRNQCLSWHQVVFLVLETNVLVEYLLNRSPNIHYIQKESW